MPSAPLPEDADLAADATMSWRMFGIAQTGQLDKSNERGADSRTIITKCEEHDRAVAARLTRPWWKFWG